MIYVPNKDKAVTIPVTGPKVGENVPIPVHGWVIFEDGETLPCVVIDGLLTPLRAPKQDHVPSP